MQALVLIIALALILVVDICYAAIESSKQERDEGIRFLFFIY